MTLRPSLLVLALGAAAPAVAQNMPHNASQAQTYTGPGAYRDQRALPDPADRDALLKARGEAYHRAGDNRQTEEELRATRALNDEITARNALADKVDADARLDYDAALARHEIAVRQGEEHARAAQDQYDRDYASWREQVRLCQSGVRTACGAPVGPAR
jgi:uncharacterized protein YdiU (UPF0061 family)